MSDSDNNPKTMKSTAKTQPNFALMIEESLKHLNDKKGSSMRDIEKYMVATYALRWGYFVQIEILEKLNSNSPDFKFGKIVFRLYSFSAILIDYRLC